MYLVDNLISRDTVSSVGLVGNKILPMVNEWEHIDIFRHALALDERRVKFIPECVMRKRHLDQDKKPVNFDEQMISLDTASGQRIPFQRLKEVWFAGSHSDVCVYYKASDTLTHSFSRGGGSSANDGNNPENAPLLWMISEAVLAGLHLQLPTAGCNLQDLHWTTEPQRSLHTVWWALEVLPIHRQSRSSRSETSHW